MENLPQRLQSNSCKSRPSGLASFLELEPQTGQDGENISVGYSVVLSLQAVFETI